MNKLVLPYREFDSKAELTKIALISPSKGNQSKWITNDGEFFVKGNFYYQYVEWKDYMVEIVASQYAGLCNLPNNVKVVPQGLCKIDERYGSYSKSFLDLGEQLTFADYIEYKNLKKVFIKSYSALDKFKLFVDTCSEATGKDCLNYFVTMLLLDAIVLNEDRHYGNILFVLKNDAYDLSPLFDFGLGLYEHDIKYSRLNRLSLFQDKVTMQPFVSDYKKYFKLLDKYNDLVRKIIPNKINISDFIFPSKFAERQFIVANRYVGVIVNE